MWNLESCYTYKCHYNEYYKKSLYVEVLSNVKLIKPKVAKTEFKCLCNGFITRR